jgi:hypothetical protein
MPKTSVILGTYNHLAEGSPGALFEETYQICWRPFLSTLYRFPELSAALHYSGTVLQWLHGNHPEFIMLLEEMSNRKQIELIGGAFFAPLMPMIPGPDRVGQLEYLTTFIRKLIGRRPRGAWTQEFAWEPSLVSTYQACGFDYTFLPQELFRAVGIGAGGPVVTEDQGKNINVLPVHALETKGERLLGLHASLALLRERHPEYPLLTLMFPDYCTRELWARGGDESPDLLFEANFAALQKDASEYETTTPQKFLKAQKAPARAYFPCSTSQLLAKRSRRPECPQAGEDGPTPHMTARSLLLRYPESAALYSKMHYVRILVGQLRGDKSRKKSAQEELWKGQCGDAYWHGNDGGLLSLPIRASAYSALIEAEKTTRHKGGFIPGIIRADLDFDGEKEILYQGADYNAYIELAEATLAEFDSFRSLTNYVNAMDGGRGGRPLHCFADRTGRPGRFAESEDERARYALVDGVKPAMTAEFSGALLVPAEGEPRRLRAGKTFSFRKGNLGVHYCLSNDGPEPLELRFSTELNLSAGLSPDLIGFRPDSRQGAVGAHPEERWELDGIDSLSLENRCASEKLEFRSERRFTARLEPIYLEASVRGRVERLFQGSRITLGWDMTIAATSDELISLNLEISRM